MLDQYGAEPFKQQQFGTAGVEGVNCVQNVSVCHSDINIFMLDVDNKAPCPPLEDDCLEDKTEDYRNCSVLCCVTQLCTVTCTLI